MANTYTLIEAKTLASAVNSITFSSIPQTYTDLILKTSIRGTSSSYFTQAVRVTFNSSTSGYTTRTLTNVGTNSITTVTNPYSVTAASISIFANNAASTTTTFNNSEIYIPNYAGSNNKSFSSDSVTETNSNGSYDIQSGFMAGLLSDTAAITSITLTAQSGEGDFATNSTFYLYGIKNS